MRHNFKKQFGQNFLKNRKFAEMMVSHLGIKDEDFVVEIGPGDGSVTKILLEKNAKVLAVEVDYDLIPKLISKFSDEKNFNLVHSDILQVNLEEEIKKVDINTKTFKLIGSLPYNISKKIIRSLLAFNYHSSEIKIEEMCFIIQDEVAKDYVEKYSFLSTTSQIYADIKKYESIPASQFTPQPKVNGGIVKFILKKISSIEYVNKLERLIKIGYSAPRKKVIKNLSNGLKLDKKELEKIFNEIELNLNLRASQINLENWKSILNKISSKL